MITAEKCPHCGETFHYEPKLFQRHRDQCLLTQEHTRQMRQDREDRALLGVSPLWYLLRKLRGKHRAQLAPSQKGHTE